MTWRGEQFHGGKTTGQNVQHYLTIWKARDYSGGIPDEVPDALMRDNLAPSWKAVALSILNNDMMLHRLGFARKSCDAYRDAKEKQLSKWIQRRLF